MKWYEPLFALFAVSAGLLAGFALGGFIMVEECRREAAQHHSGEYYIDENHERQWRWLDETKEKK